MTEHNGMTETEHRQREQAAMAMHAPEEALPLITAEAIVGDIARMLNINVRSQQYSDEPAFLCAVRDRVAAMQDEASKGKFREALMKSAPPEGMRAEMAKMLEIIGVASIEEAQQRLIEWGRERARSKDTIDRVKAERESALKANEGLQGQCRQYKTDIEALDRAILRLKPTKRKAK